MGLGEVVLLVGGILLFNLVLWVVVLSLLKKRQLTVMTAFAAELASGGATVLRGPESAIYRGASAGRTKVKGNGVVALTQTHVLFRPLIGNPIDVPRAEIEALREDTWFLRSYAGGRMHTILKLKDGSEVGYQFKDPAAWAAALKP